MVRLAGSGSREQWGWGAIRLRKILRAAPASNGVCGEGGIRTQDRPDGPVTCGFYVAPDATFAHNAADHCTLLHAGGCAGSKLGLVQTFRL